MKSRKWVFGLLFLLLLGIGGFFYFQSHDPRKLIIEPFAQDKKCPYDHINPNRCEPELAKKSKEYIILRNELNDEIAANKKNGTLTNAAIYFRDLQNGPIISIDDQQDFIPASLLKVPLMMTYYKKAETDPKLLLRKVTVDGSVATLSQNITPGQSAQIGKTYTIDQLISLMITQSDNVSWELLLTDLRKNYSINDFISTLSDLGIVDPSKRTDQQYMTVQTYAAVFRMLYNSSYLNIQMSDKALDVLANSSFHDGIEAGVPDDLDVAHKFGEQKDGDSQQLHDCGIVYYPKNPYIICVMTEGSDISDLSAFIKDVSQKVYQEVVSRNTPSQ